MNRFDSAQRVRVSKAVAVQEAARNSLSNLSKHISVFILDYGLSVSEVNSIWRTAIVQAAAARQLERSSRVNLSGIAAITGIARGEVSRILSSGESLTIRAIERYQKVTSRILNAWHRDPRFLTVSRRPRKLKIFGGGLTFESLVKKYGQGIPIRAILDELNRVGAIQLQTRSQNILAKVRAPVDPRLTQKKVRDFDAALDDLFSSELNCSESAVVEKVSGSKVWSGPAALVRRRLRSNALALQQELQDKMAIKQAKHRPGDEQKIAHLSATMTYKEEQTRRPKRSLKGRRNFCRNR